MPKNLQDLDEVIIRRIGYFLHEDSFIPLPSFNPHWLNLKSDLNTRAGKDYRSLSNTSRKLKGILPLRGLHLELTRWYRLERWVRLAPKSVLGGVRRLVIDIEQTEKLAQQSLISKWLMLAEFLQLLTSLQELTIINIPLCQHDQVAQLLRRHITLHLPRLVSLDLRADCTLCSTVWIHPFLLVSSDLLSLRAVIQNGIEESFAISIEEFKKIHNVTEHPLRRLLIKVRAPEHSMKVIERLSTIFPRLETLLVSPHSIEEPYPIVPSLYLGVFPPRKNSIEEMKLLLMGGDVKVERLLMDTIQREGVTIDESLRRLSQLRNIRVIDLGMRICIGQNKERPNPYLSATPNKYKTAQHYFNQLKNLKGKNAKYQDYKFNLQTAFRMIAEKSVKYFPSLEVIYIWEVVRGKNDIAKQWNRWCCRIEHDSQAEDQIVVMVDPIPENTIGDWTTNDEGTGPEAADLYHSDHADD
ncbi:uncharacterized protein I303_107138 [Kwoniella dejecticola CBS 10117]|uniref:Uncharacterized protein n=1 Tax=Kwoniella dejecticola CBS 10117 TaxID=1296121 RepID=A0A1A5ZYU4_9TREE|nr:uncharacterized protein I303_06539 [Kwoniella dejecticola CBS 10117]OBR82981.1 hypothetical protein I303_06539 [Kwoniella dejecticola CBS 10117]